MKKGLVENILILSLSLKIIILQTTKQIKKFLSLSQLITTNNKLLQKSLFIVTVYCTTGST